MSRQQPHHIAKQGFEKGSNIYGRARPKYPLEAINYIQTILPKNAQVVDLGAGTGIMTKFLVEHAQFEVTAVEPVDGMRDQLRLNVPGVKCIVNGTSWNTSLSSESQDAVIVAQAFHWFDDLKTLQEAHRILKSGGRLLLIWNKESKENSEWIKELQKLSDTYYTDAPQYRKNDWQKVWQTPEAQQLFTTPLHHQHFEYNLPFTRDQIFPRILSKSSISVLPKDEQDRLKVKVDAVLDNPALGFAADPQTGCFIYPHVTDLYWAQKKSKLV
ncbi:S-adenosyl-L-methionine-dependent methyltransferase [Chlamydoabsidia padenii]|nr:S-adenosyl-L-methionine-dependent methyltransferase [Chlamydoabsidia padenii]